MERKPNTPPPTPSPQTKKPEEVGGAKRETDPARFGDWEINGKCVDF